MSGYADHVPESCRIDNPPTPSDLWGGSEQAQSSASRLPEYNSVNASSARNRDSGEFGVDAETVRRIEERVEEFRQKYPDRAKLPLSREPGEKMLASYVVEEYTEETVEPETDFEQSFTVRRLERAEPVTWDEAVRTTLLERHQYDAGVVGEFEDRHSGESFNVAFTDAWTSEYAETQRAKNAGAQRQLMGGEYPEHSESARSGELEPGLWDSPVSVLLSLSGSAAPHGELLPPVDHAREVDTWSDCYHRVRNLVEYELGVPSGSWGYTRADDVHGLKDKGHTNAGYTHQHAVIFFDLEAAEVPDLPELELEEWVHEKFHDKVVSKHVDECHLASEEAHGEKSVDVEMELGAAGAYASAYALPAPEKPMVERPIEYVAWASVLRASGTQRIARSKLFTDAAKADLCKQQTGVVHGERLMYDRSGHSSELVCECCGSGVGIGETMTAHRVSDSGPAVVATDGGEAVEERPEMVVVGARVGESRERAEVRQRAQQYIDVNGRPGEVSPGLLGEMGVSPEHADVVGEVLRGEDSSTSAEPIEGVRRDGEESRYELQQLVAANGETREIAGGAGGAQYRELVLPVEDILRKTRLQYVGDGCHPKIVVELSEGEGGRLATYNPETAARALVNAGVRIPWVADRALSFELTERPEFEEPVPPPHLEGEVS